MVPLPVWRRKGKKHATKRKGNNPASTSDKKRKFDETTLERSSPGRKVRLLSDSDESVSSRNVVCVSDEERAGGLEPGSGLTLSVPELDSIVTVRSQINLLEVQEPEISESMMREILDLVSEPSGSKELSEDLSNSKPRVGMSSGKAKSFRPYPKIADSRNYTYDEMIEYQEKFNDFDDFQFDIDDMEKEFYVL